MDDRNYKGHLAMFGANLIFGLNTPISKTILLQNTVSPYALTFFRMAGAAIMFWILSFFTKKEHVTPKDVLLLFFASMFGIQLNQVSFLIGLSMTSPIDASVIATLTPILTMILASIFLKEPITWKKAMGVLIGASGALILVLTGTHLNGKDGSIEGNMLCILSTFGFATYLTVFRNLIRRYSPVTLMKWMFLFAAICCSPLCYKDITTINYASLSLDMYWRIAYVVIAATFLSYMLIPIGQKLLRPTVVSMYNYEQPIISTLVAVALGIDIFGWTKGVAAILVFIGVYIVTISKSRAQMEAEAAKKNLNINK